MQFFVRNITGTLLGLSPFLVGLLLIILGQQFWVIDTIKEWDPFPIGALIFTAIISLSGLIPWYILCVNVCKRAHDYNHRWLLYNLAYYVGAPLVYISSIICTVFYVHDLGGGAMMMGILIWLSLSSVIQIITWSILQLRKWNPWSNKYGPAPTGKPLV